MRDMIAKLALVCTFSVLLISSFARLSYAKIDLECAKGIWFFDDDDEEIAADSSGNGNDGTLMNGPKYVAGKFGKALKLDGVDDFVDTGDAPSLSFGESSFSVSAWINTSKSGGSYNGWIMDTQLAGSLNSGYDLYICNNYLVFRVCNGSELSTGKAWDGNKEITDGNWHHVVGTLDREAKFISKYVDGELDGEMALQFEGDFSNAFSLKFGTYHGANDPQYLFEGIIDEVAVFDRALTDDEVESIMAMGLDRALALTAVYPRGKLASKWSEIKN